MAEKTAQPGIMRARASSSIFAGGSRTSGSRGGEAAVELRTLVRELLQVTGPISSRVVDRWRVRLEAIATGLETRRPGEG